MTNITPARPTVRARKNGAVDKPKNLPAKPYVGLTFRPYGTDAVGTIVEVTPREVTYTFKHDEPDAVRHSRAYGELRRIAHYLGRHSEG